MTRPATRPANPAFRMALGEHDLDLDRAIDLSIPIVAGRAAYAFSLPDVTRAPFRAGGFTGDVRAGGSVNCPILTFCAHGNGTHTEGVGHIVEDDVSVLDLVPYGPMPACVLTVSTVALGDSEEHTDGTHDAEDRVVSARALAAARRAIAPHPDHLFAVVLRVEDARGDPARIWSDCDPPYFTREAMGLLRDWGTHHFLTELPSLDRENDGGRTPAHHKYFGLPLGMTKLEQPPEPRTVTELIVIPDEVPDGVAFVDLQVAPFHADAAPSRPMLFPLR